MRIEDLNGLVGGQKADVLRLWRRRPGKLKRCKYGRRSQMEVLSIV